MSLINVSNLTFAYEGSYDNIFTDVSFQIDTDWKLGFCGRNGRGKTTFLKLLMGMYEYSGSITSSVSFEYFPFAADDTSRRTKDILSSIAPNSKEWQFLRELSKLSVNEDTLQRPFSTLSNGEQTKALLAGLFLRENSFLLIDEPTNHLDMASRETVSKYLDEKDGYILVSHDRAFLDGCVDHILSINRANIEIQSGNFSSWFHNKQMQDEFELAADEKLRKDIKRLKAAARQSSQWADKVESTKIGKGTAVARKNGHVSKDSRAYIGEQSRRMQQRRKNLERRQSSAIEEKSGLLKNIETADDLKIHPLAYHSARLITAEDLTIAYGDRAVVSGVNFTLQRGERVALMGPNGSGKSSIIKLICSEAATYADAGAAPRTSAEIIPRTGAGAILHTDKDAVTDAYAGAAPRTGTGAVPHSGEVTVSSRLVISYVPQDASYLTGNLDDFASEQQIDVSLFKAILRKLDFSRVQFEKDMRDFSAGQKKKALIAASLCKQAHVYIWDEPLNYIDVLSRIQIEELISAYKPAMLFVEHDRAFCDNVATKIVEL